MEDIRGIKDVEEEFEDLKVAVEQSAAHGLLHSWKALCQRKHRPQLVISACFMICQQFSGMNSIM